MRKEFYPTSARLLLKLAEAENEHWANNATGVFIDHFQLYLSGTEAEPSEKFKIIKEILNQDSVKQKEIAVKALNTALLDEPFAGDEISIMETPSGKTFKDWQPKTWGERWDYHRQALEYLTSIIETDNNSQKIKDQAREVIACNINSLLTYIQLYGDVKKTINCVIDVYGRHWPKAFNNIQNLIQYNKKLTPEHKKNAEEFLELLHPQPKDMKQQLRHYITECPYNMLYNDNSKKSEQYNKKIIQLAKDFKKYLETEDEDKKVSALHTLFHGEQRNTINFSRELSLVLENSENFLTKLLENIKIWKKNKNFNPSFLCGFMKGLKKPDAVQKILDVLSHEEDLHDLILPAYHCLELKDLDIKRLIKIIKTTNLDTINLSNLSIAQRCKLVSPKCMAELVTALLNKNTKYNLPALEIYNYYVYGNTETKQNFPADTLFQIITKQELLTDSKQFRHSLEYSYEKAVMDIMETKYANKFAVFFFDFLLEYRKPLSNLRVSFNCLQNILRQILKKYPDIFLKKLSEKLNSSLDMRFIFRHSLFLSEQNPLSSIDETALKKWCKTDVKVVVFLAENLRLLERTSWSPFARFLLDEYGDQESLTEAVSANISSFFWKGPLSQYYENIKTAMEELKNHKHQNVRDFAENQIHYLEEKIQREKQNEEVREKLNI